MEGYVKCCDLTLFLLKKRLTVEGLVRGLSDGGVGCIIELCRGGIK